MRFWKICAIAMALPASAFADGLQVLDAWIPVAPPGVHSHAAYISLENGGDTSRALIGVSSADFGMVHLHESKMTDGIMTMAPLAQVEIPSGGNLLMEPGGLHVMMMQPKTHLMPGATVTLSLIFNDGEVLEVLTTVKGRDEGS